MEVGRTGAEVAAEIWDTGPHSSIADTFWL